VDVSVDRRLESLFQVQWPADIKEEARITTLLC
jgi:hypothetical protein